MATDFFSMSSTVSSWTGAETADLMTEASREVSASGFNKEDPRSPSRAWVLR